MNLKYRNLALLIGIFALMTVALIYVGNTARNRFDAIIETLIEDQQQEDPEAHVQQVQANLAEIELAVKVYILTNSDSALVRFYELNFALIDEFEALEQSAADYDPTILSALDSLETLSFNWINNFEELVETRDEFRVEKAMSKVESAVELAAAELNKPAVTDTSSQAKTKKRALRKLFSKNKKEQLEQMLSAEETDENEHIVAAFQDNIKQLSRAEGQRERTMRLENLRIASQGQVIRSRVDSLATLISDIKEERYETKQEHIKALATSSNESMKYTIIIGVLFVLVFSILIFIQARATMRYMKASKVASEEAMELARSKENFIANVSHELRTPLNAIIGFSELIDKEGSKSKRAEYLRIVRESGRHLKALINDLLDWTKLDAGAFQLESKAFSPEVVISEAREMVFSQHRHRGIQLRTYTNIRHFELWGDPVRLKQIMINLLQNAFKFTDEGEVRLNIEERELDDQHIMLEVSITDTGIGIGKRHLHKIFTHFHQVDAHRNRKYEGSGLGLAISKKIIEQQGGQITIESEVNKGTTVTFEIPYKINRDHPEQTEKSVALNTRGFQVLIADDSEFNRQLLSSILMAENIPVLEAENGKQALDLLAGHDIDLCIFDIKMPGMDGIELAKNVLNQYGKNAPTMLALTAAQTDDVQKQCIEAGYEQVISKPLDRNELFSVLNRLFGDLIDIQEYAPPAERQQPEIKQKTQFDPRRLDKIFQGDSQFRNEMLRVFLETFERELNNMEVALAADDAVKVDDIAHKITPSCRHIGAYSLVKQLESIRSESKQSAPDMASIKNQIDALNDQYQNVATMIKKVIAQSI